MRLALTVLAACLTACTAESPPPAPPPRPVAVRPTPDFFQQKLAEARRARAAHLPRSDAAGAKRDYDAVMRDACAQIARTGPERYMARCAAIARPSLPLAPIDDDDCAEPTADPARLKACND